MTRKRYNAEAELLNLLCKRWQILLQGRLAAGIGNTLYPKLFFRPRDNFQQLIERNNMFWNQRLIVHVATATATNIATLKPYCQPFERAFRFRTAIYRRNIELNHFQN